MCKVPGCKLQVARLQVARFSSSINLDAHMGPKYSKVSRVVCGVGGGGGLALAQPQPQADGSRQPHMTRVGGSGRVGPTCNWQLLRAIKPSKSKLTPSRWTNTTALVVCECVPVCRNLIAKVPWPRHHDTRVHSHKLKDSTLSLCHLDLAAHVLDQLIRLQPQHTLRP